MGRPRADAGFTPGSIRHPAAIAPTNANHATTSGMAGASPGRRIAAFSTTARRRDPMALRGASARSWCGGMQRPRAGAVSTSPTTSRRSIPITSPHPAPAATTRWAERRRFIMHPDGLGWLWVPGGLKDGPLPRTTSHSSRRCRTCCIRGTRANPAADKMERPDNPYVPAGDRRFPHVLTTYRLTEHHTAGGMSRYVSHLAELQPEFFAEISPELAGEIGATHGGWVTVASPRGVVEARALVTSRMPSLRVDGRLIHQVGLPYHWGTRGLVTGDRQTT